MRDVVAAVIEREGRILLTQRAPTGSFPYLWECPGGKVEPGEIHAQALYRELHEELGLWQSEIGELLDTRIFSAEICSVETRLSHYLVTYPDHVRSSGFVLSWVQVPRPLVAVGLGWFDRRALAVLPGTPGLEAIKLILLT